MLVEGNNTYATVEFADEYIAESYTSHNPLRVHFSVLTNEEKEAYLRKALQEIERLHFVGRKYLVSQQLQFPRVRRGSLCGVSPTYASLFIGVVRDDEIPACVKQAQVENALGIIANEIAAVSDKQFMTLQSLGIIKNTKYNKREAGDLGFGADITGATASRCPLSSTKAYELLRAWLGGVFVC